MICFKLNGVSGQVKNIYHKHIYLKKRLFETFHLNILKKSSEKCSKEKIQHLTYIYTGPCDTYGTIIINRSIINNSVC